MTAVAAYRKSSSGAKDIEQVRKRVDDALSFREEVLYDMEPMVDIFDFDDLVRLEQAEGGLEPPELSGSSILSLRSTNTQGSCYARTSDAWVR